MLAPNVDLVNELLTNLLWSWSSIQRAAVTARHTEIFAPSQQPPSWFGPLSQTIGELHTAADGWLDRDGAEALSSLPQTFIDYGNLFVTSAGELPDATRETQIRLLQNLLQKAHDCRSATMAQESKIDHFLMQLAARRHAVHEGITSAQTTLNADEAEAKALAARINQILASVGIDDASADHNLRNASVSAASIVVGVLYYNIATALEASAGSPLGGLAVATVGVTVSAITIAAKEQKVIDALRQVTDLQVELTQEQQQIYALQSIFNSLQALESSLRRSTGNVGIEPLWDDTAEQLQTLIDRLNAGVDGALLTELVTLPKATQRWHQIVTSAGNTQNAVAEANARIVVAA